MKKVSCLISAVLLIFAVGCTPSEKKEDVPPAPKTPVAEAPAPVGAAPQQPESAKQIVEGYSRGLVTSLDKARLVQARTDLGAINDAVRNYQVDNGKYPATLDDVKGFLRAGTDLRPFSYDPATGNVTIK